MACFLGWLILTLSWIVSCPVIVNGQSSTVTVVIDAFPGTTVEQGTSVALVCQVVGILSSAVPTFSWTCPRGNCPTGTVRVRGDVVLVDVIDSATHGGMYTCMVTVEGNVSAQSANLVVEGGFAFSSVDRSTFIPQDSLLASAALIPDPPNVNSASVVCHSFGANPDWMGIDRMSVPTNDSFPVYQMADGNTARLLVSDISLFTNGVYQCLGNGTVASLGLFINTPVASNRTLSMLTGSPTAMDTISLSWTAEGSPMGADYFISFVRTDLADLTPQWIFTSVPTTAQDLTGLLGGTNYSITLSLVEGTGLSNKVSTTAATMEGTPTAPRSLMLVMGGPGVVELDWLPPLTPNGDVTYTVQQQEGGSSVEATTMATSYPVANQPSGMNVTFTVVAMIGASSSEASNSVTFCDDTGLIAPGNPSAMASSSTSITVMWDPVNLDCPSTEGYRVVQDSGTGNNTMMVNFTVTEAMISGLPPFTSITVFIAAISGGGDGPAAMVAETTLLQAPMVNTTTTTNATFASWNRDENAVQYIVTLSGPDFMMSQTTMGTNVTFDGLVPATTYTLTVQGMDTMGRDGDPAVVNITTDRTLPSMPQNLTASSITGGSITVSWSEPEVLGDTSVSYTVAVNDVESQRVVGLSAVITGLMPGTSYSIAVAALNSVGPSPAVTRVFMTLDQPPAVQDVTVTAASNTSVTLNWAPSVAPNDTGNTISGYAVEVFIVNTSTNNSNRNESVVGNVSTTVLDMLSPGIPYFVSVRVNESLRGIGLPGNSAVFFSAELVPQDDVMVQNVDTRPINSSAIQATWDAIPLIQARRFFTYTATLSESSAKRQTPPSMTVSCTNMCSADFIVVPGVSYTVQVGITGFPATISMPRSIPTIPTPATPPTAASTDNTAIIVGIVIAGVVVIGLLVAVLVVLFVFFYRSSGKRSEGYAFAGSSHKYQARDGTQTSSAQNLISMSNLETDEQREELVAEHKRIIALDEFPAYVSEMHKDRDQGYEEEYRLFRTDLVNTAKAAQEFILKNRYGNIFAYDHARVVMKDPDEDGCDYINASYMDGYQAKNAYIATQGPVPETIEDFWQMVWEQKTPIIIMLTRVDEGGRRKCEPYWPDSKEEPVVTKRGVQVTLSNIEPFADFEIRTLTVKCKKEPDAPDLEVKHFYYTVWPDHGVPQYATSLIKFIRRVRKFQSQIEGTAPIIVHCSAGVGRSGTYICLDAMLQRMQREGNFNVFEFVTQMRDNRTYMVQTLDQYIFIHDAIHELIVCGDTSIPAPSMRIKVNRLLKTLPDSTRTGFVHQFELLSNVSHVPINAEISEGLAEYNKPKNRVQDCIPYNLGRPRLLGVGFHSGADYINGSLVDGYKTRNYFITTQGPLANTINDFWLMVWQNKTACIVMLCDTMEAEKENSTVYWSDEVGFNAVYGKITVTLKSSTEADGFVTRKFEVLEEGKAAPPLKVTQLHYKGWTETACPKDHKPLLKVIGDMEKVQQATGNNPIVVMCSNGTGRSGAYVTIYAQIERMKVEGIVDLFQYIKLARLQRVNLVQTLDQYTFCHELMVSYLDSFEGYANFEFK